MSKVVDYYNILGISIFASDEEIRAGYLTKIKQYHPDTYKGNKKEAENLTSYINEAYKILKDKDTKFVYDTKFGFDGQREQIKKDQEKAEAKKQKEERKKAKKHFTPSGEYAEEKQKQQEAFKETIFNYENSNKDEKIKTNIFTKEPTSKVHSVTGTVLTDEQKRIRHERLILDFVIIGLLVIVILLIIFH